MTHLRNVIIAILALAAAPAALAQTLPPGQQQPAPPAAAAVDWRGPRTGVIDFGVRINSVDGDRARFERFQDLRDGPILQALRYTRSTGAWEFNAAFDNPGYRDQRFAADWNRYGRVRASFTWDQIPWFHSIDTRTAYTNEGGGTLRLPDSLQGAGLPVVGAAGGRFDTLARRDIADARVSFAPNTATDFNLSFQSIKRTGEQPWGAGFGMTAADEVPLPLDQRTNDLNATLQWANQGRLLQVGYNGSFYNNDVPVLVWDSPLTAIDAVGNPAQGRMPIFPSSVAHTVSALGAVPLPWRSRVHAYLSIGTWSQDEALVPHTVNTALPVVPLSRTSADAEARIIATNIGFNSRPARSFMINGRFRIYDFDNRTPPFAQPQYVRADQTVGASVLGASEPFEYRRQFVDANAVYSGIRHLALRAGYSLEHNDRQYRYVERTNDHILRASVDSTSLSRVMMRVQYEHAERTGDGLDEQVLSEISEQISLRQFDISDRTRDRVSAVFQVMPVDTLGVTATVGAGRDDRPDEFFGLLDNNHLFYTVAVDLTPSDAVSATLSYGRENYDTRQRSRQANPGPQFDDPTRDWETDMDEHANTITAVVELPRVTSKTSLRFSYDYSQTESRYLYVLPSNTTLATPEQLPPVENALHHARTDVRYDVTTRWGIGVSYWFDKYSVEDFAREPQTLTPIGVPSGLYLGYLARPFTGHTASVRAIIGW